VETKRSVEALAAAGIRPGRAWWWANTASSPFLLGNGYIASYTLDNKASIAILLALAERVPQAAVPIYLVFSAKEEVGAVGALYFSQRHSLDGLIALEICPLSREYPIQPGAQPVLLAQDNYGLYDEGLTQQLAQAANTRNIPVKSRPLAALVATGPLP
jgi:putative aminopeptidase FrvX